MPSKTTISEQTSSLAAGLIEGKDPVATTTKGKTKTAKKERMADVFDRHVCYQLSVQAVDAEIDFVDQTFEELRNRKAVSIREDFCGTANSACEWVGRRSTNVAYAVDLDPDPLEWGREHNLGKLKPAQRKRVNLVQDNVLTAPTPSVDCVLAMNFSWQIFKTRARLRKYFEAVHASLRPGGAFFLDIYGGYESFQETTDSREIDATRAPELGIETFDYIWDQHRYDPVTGDMDCFIHFKFPDGSKMKDAFCYNWRLWTIPEVREVLEEAGFRLSTVYWEGTDEDTNEGDGIFSPAQHGEADPAFVAYIVAEP